MICLSGYLRHSQKTKLCCGYIEYIYISISCVCEYACVCTSLGVCAFCSLRSLYFNNCCRKLSPRSRCYSPTWPVGGVNHPHLSVYFWKLVWILQDLQVTALLISNVWWHRWIKTSRDWSRMMSHRLVSTVVIARILFYTPVYPGTVKSFVMDRWTVHYFMFSDRLSGW